MAGLMRMSGGRFSSPWRMTPRGQFSMMDPESIHDSWTVSKVLVPGDLSRLSGAWCCRQILRTMICVSRFTFLSLCHSVIKILFTNLDGMTQLSEAPQIDAATAREQTDNLCIGPAGHALAEDPWAGLVICTRQFNVVRKCLSWQSTVCSSMPDNWTYRARNFQNPDRCLTAVRDRREPLGRPRRDFNARTGRYPT